MPQNFFITGIPKSGKTTLLSRIADELKSHGLRVGGFVSPEEKAHGTRTGFYVMNIESGEMGLLADLNADGPKVSKYHVDIKSFETIALPVMRKSERYDVVIIDEIGRMELKSRKFADMLDMLLESHTPLIASLHGDFVERYGQSGEVIFLEENNREAVYRELVEKIKTIGKKPKAAPAGKGRKAAEKKKPQVAAGRKWKESRKREPEEAPRKQEKREVPRKQERKSAKETRKAGKSGKGFVDHLKELLGF